MDSSRNIIWYTGQSSEEIDEKLSEQDGFLFMLKEEGYPFYITLVKNEETTTINFTCLDKDITIREFIHLCKRNGPTASSQNVSLA